MRTKSEVFDANPGPGGTLSQPTEHYNSKDILRIGYILGKKLIERKHSEENSKKRKNPKEKSKGEILKKEKSKGGILKR